MPDQSWGSQLIFCPCPALDAPQLGVAGCISGRKEKVIQILVKNFVPITERYSCCPPTVLLKGRVLRLILFPLLSPNEGMQGDGSQHVPRVPPTQCQSVFKGARPGLLHDSLELLLFLGLLEQQEGTSKEVLP